MKVRILANDDVRLSHYEVGAVVDMPKPVAERWEIRGKVTYDISPQKKRRAKRATRKKRRTDETGGAD